MNIRRLYHLLAAGFLLLTLIVQCFSKNLIFADYYLNTGTYLKKCVNKSRPQMRCKGKCQMMKKLKEEQKKEQQLPERKSDQKYDGPISSKSFFTSISDMFITAGNSKHIFPLIIGSTRDVSFELLRPPGV